MENLPIPPRGITPHLRHPLPQYPPCQADAHPSLLQGGNSPKNSVTKRNDERRPSAGLDAWARRGRGLQPADRGLGIRGGSPGRPGDGKGYARLHVNPADEGDTEGDQSEYRCRSSITEEVVEGVVEPSARLPAGHHRIKRHLW
jgi:hypothetical protein